MGKTMIYMRNSIIIADYDKKHALLYGLSKAISDNSENSCLNFQK